MGCAYEAGRGSYWGPWAIVAAMVLWTALALPYSWRSYRRDVYWFSETRVALALTVGYVGGGSGIYFLRDTVAWAASMQAPTCNSWAHLWLTFSWLLVPLPAACFCATVAAFIDLTRQTLRPSRASRKDRQ